MIPNRKRISFNVAFPDVPEPVVDVWRAITGFLKEQRCLPKRFEISQLAGHPPELRSERWLKLEPTEIEELIAQRGLNAFQITSGRAGDGVAFWLRHPKGAGPAYYLRSIVEKRAKAPSDWSRLIEGLLTLWPTFGGWQWSSLYRAWQNVSFLDDHYRRAYGEVPPGLHTYIRSDPPFIPGFSDKVRIDCSLHPGRCKELLSAVYFYPTAEMWLGPHFWQYAKCTKEEVLAADFFIEKRDTPNYLYLKCWPEPFTRPDGEQGRMQQRLWRLLFHEDCEWPPGSGTISDVPLYGPPELMPSSVPSGSGS